MVWLIEAVAWKPRGDATRFGAVHNERGQLSITERALAKEWSWPKTNVRRYLLKLAAEGTITLELARCGPKTEPQDRPQTGYERTLITLCNYDKFQGMLLGKRTGADQRADQKADQKPPELPGLIYAVAQQPNNQTNHKESKNRLGNRLVKKSLPPHGKVWKGLIFCHHDTRAWREHARDYEDVRGTPIFPRRYLNGWGNWFVVLGEASREPWQATG